MSDGRGLIGRIFGSGFIKYAGLSAVFLSFIAIGTMVTFGVAAAILATVVAGTSLAIGLSAYGRAFQYRAILEVQNGIDQLGAQQMLSGVLQDKPFPLSPFAVSPDTAALLVRELLAKHPRNVVEFGSGLSTVVMAKCLSLTGQGLLYTVDEEEEYADRTRRLLSLHGLQEWCQLVVAPVETAGDGKRWYRCRSLEKCPEKVDFVFVDGPRVMDDPDVRSPVLPFVWPRLTTGGVVVLDDGKRDGERRLAQEWGVRFPAEAHVEFVDTRRGAWIIRKR